MIECGMFKHMSFLVSSIYSRMTDLKRYRWSDLTKSLVKSRAASGKHGGLTITRLIQHPYFQSFHRCFGGDHGFSNIQPSPCPKVWHFGTVTLNVVITQSLTLWDRYPQCGYHMLIMLSHIQTIHLPATNQLPSKLGFPSLQWPFQEPKVEVPTIYKAYIRPM